MIFGNFVLKCCQFGHDVCNFGFACTGFLVLLRTVIPWDI
jgi:hypothetical protein